MSNATASMCGPSPCRTDVRPPVKSFSPSMWGDIFSTFSLDYQLQEKYAQGIETLKKQVKMMLISATSEKSITLIDTLERLGLAYHFETEINEKLEKIYNYNDHVNDLGSEDEEYYHNLFLVALGFRLLRQHRYHVSCDVFTIFLDKGHKFKTIIDVNDVEGLLSLYEAGNVQIHGEDILEEALAFSIHHLTRMLPQLNSCLKDKVQQALEMPLHKGITIIHVRHYISIYERENTRDELLLKLAKFNFNYLQNLYKKELCQLSKWWDDFDLKSKLPYARDRLVECYLWGMAWRFEPQYSYVRIAVAKSMEMVTIMDDTYDNYATLDEAQLFTDILGRWNMDEIDQLPDWMKIVYQFIMSIYQDYEREAAEEGKSFSVPYFKEAVKELGRAYYQELEWLMKRRIPSFEDYFANSIITSCVYVMFFALLPGMKSATQETIDWLLSEPKIVISTAKMGRLLDDLASHERESNEGKILTLVDCRIKYHGLSKEETLVKLVKQVDDGWKDLNTEWVAKTFIPKDIVEQFLNYTRSTMVTYGKSDGFTNPEKVLAPNIMALLIDPIPV